MRHFAITGIETAAIISRIFFGDAMRATPPSARICAGTRSSAMTATAPACSAMVACSELVTSMMTPPLSISARPVLRRRLVLVPLFFDMVDSEKRFQLSAVSYQLTLWRMVPGGFSPLIHSTAGGGNAEPRAILSRDSKSKSKLKSKIEGPRFKFTIKINGDGQECPPHICVPLLLTLYELGEH